MASPAGPRQEPPSDLHPEEDEDVDPRPHRWGAGEEARSGIGANHLAASREAMPTWTSITPDTTQMATRAATSARATMNVSSSRLPAVVSLAKPCPVCHGEGVCSRHGEDRHG